MTTELNPMPTVDQLVQVFRERNWTPTRHVGASLDQVASGQCCAIPALACLVDPNCLDAARSPEDWDMFDIYGFIYRHYGESARWIYRGFDDWPEPRLNIENLDENRSWWRLGQELYRVLTEGAEDENQSADR